MMVVIANVLNNFTLHLQEKRGSFSETESDLANQSNSSCS